MVTPHLEATSNIQRPKEIKEKLLRDPAGSLSYVKTSWQKQLFREEAKAAATRCNVSGAVAPQEMSSRSAAAHQTAAHLNKIKSGTSAELAEGILFKSDNILRLLLELIQLIVFSPIRVYSPL